MKKFYKLLIIGIAFGIIEGSVVVYLRPLLNPGESDFSLRIIPYNKITNIQKIIIITEYGREIATLILIAAIAWLAAKTIWQWLAYFVFTFVSYSRKTCKIMVTYYYSCHRVKIV